MRRSLNNQLSQRVRVEKRVLVPSATAQRQQLLAERAERNGMWCETAWERLSNSVYRIADETGAWTSTQVSSKQMIWLFEMYKKMLSTLCRIIDICVFGCCFVVALCLVFCFFPFYPFQSMLKRFYTWYTSQEIFKPNFGQI